MLPERFSRYAQGPELPPTKIDPAGSLAGDEPKASSQRAQIVDIKRPVLPDGDMISLQGGIQVSRQRGGEVRSVEEPVGDTRRSMEADGLEVAGQRVLLHDLPGGQIGHRHAVQREDRLRAGCQKQHANGERPQTTFPPPAARPASGAVLIHLTGLHSTHYKEPAARPSARAAAAHGMCGLRGHVTTRTKFYWVAILYFAEGFPFGIIKDALPVFFRVHGVRLADIGLLTPGRASLVSQVPVGARGRPLGQTPHLDSGLPDPARRSASWLSWQLTLPR